MSENSILLVDDSPLNLQVLAEILQENGYSLSLSSNGKDAIEYVKAESRSSLMVIDLQKVAYFSELALIKA